MDAFTYLIGVSGVPYWVQFSCYVQAFVLAHDRANQAFRPDGNTPYAFVYLLTLLSTGTLFLLPSLALAHHTLRTIHAAPMVMMVAIGAMKACRAYITPAKKD